MKGQGLRKWRKVGGVDQGLQIQTYTAGGQDCSINLHELDE